MSHQCTKCMGSVTTSKAPVFLPRPLSASIARVWILIVGCSEYKDQTFRTHLIAQLIADCAVTGGG